MIFDAIEFAMRAHRGQYRKDSRVPYIVHPLGVAEILLEYGGTELLAVAGILHDTVEDTPVTLAQIRERFGEEVGRLVEDMTEPDKTWPWERRKQHTLEVLKTAPVDLLLVACADKLDNIRSVRRAYAQLGDAVWARFKRPMEKQRWYYQSLAQIFLDCVDGGPGDALFREFISEVVQVFGTDGLDLKVQNEQ